MNSTAPHPVRSSLAIGGPVFNFALVAILMTISFLAVALPDGVAEVAGDGAADGSPSGEAVARIVPPSTTSMPTTSTSTSTSTTTTSTTTVAPVEPTPVEPAPVAPAPVRPTPVVERESPPPPAPQPVAAVRPPTTTSPPRPECSDHAEQPDAQALFDTDPVLYAYFDGDGDGRACEDLPGAPPEVPPAPEPPPVLSVAAVRKQQGVFGLHTREAPWFMGELDYVTRLIGKAPNNLLFFSNWSKPFPAEQVATAWARGMTPQVAWEPVVPGADSQPKLQEIIDGEWDDYIDEWARAAAAHGQPIVLRLASEMNGNWYPWSERGFGNSPGQYAPMWRHVHERFEAAGADNVVWLWSVNRVDNQPTDIATYWPGEEYVDWVGISGYWRGFEAAPEPTFEAVFDRTLGELRAITDKPILLAEIGAGTDVDTDRVDWLDTVFDGLATNSDVIGFVYFNDQKAGGDWRIQFSQGMVDVFAAGVGSSRWPSGVLPEGMAPGERLMVPAFGDPEVDLGEVMPGGDDPGTPVEESDAPVEEPDPVEESDAPVEESDAPVEEPDAPAEEPDPADVDEDVAGAVDATDPGPVDGPDVAEPAADGADSVDPDAADPDVGGAVDADAGPSGGPQTDADVAVDSEENRSGGSQTA